MVVKLLEKGRHKLEEKFTIDLYCLVCGEHFESEVESIIPEGWGNRFMYLCDEDSFCPKHSDMLSFLGDQCPGCVATFPDCPLYKAIFTRYPDITSSEMKVIEGGVCPRRVNGTFMVSSDGKSLEVEDTNISDVSKDGMAFANGIREYLSEWSPAHLEVLNEN